MLLPAHEPLTLSPCCLHLGSVLASVLFQSLPVQLFLPSGVVPERVNVAQKVQARVAVGCRAHYDIAPYRASV